MSSLYIVGCGKENFQNFISFLQIELREFMITHNASFYNTKTLWLFTKKTAAYHQLETKD